MRKLIFYILVFLMLAWTVFAWHPFFSDMSHLAATGEKATAGTALGLVFSLFFWCLGIVPLGIFAMLARPR